MKKLISALIQRPRSADASIVRAQSSPTTLSARSTSFADSFAKAKRSWPNPANPQLKTFFSRWLDAWRSQNGGVRQ
jgi:hypothetical protein